MSDMRIQNLLQSMRQGHAAHKGGYTLSDVRFDLGGDALSSSLKNLLGSITGKMNVIAQSSMLEMRVVEKDENGKITLAHKNEFYDVTIPKDQREDAKDFKAGDKLVLISGAQDGAADDLYLFAKIDGGKFNPAGLNVTQPAPLAVAVDDVNAPLPITAEQRFVERMASLVDLEAKIDALRALIPRADLPATSVLRSFTVDLDHPATQLVVPKVAAVSVLPLPLLERDNIVADIGLSAPKAQQAPLTVTQGAVQAAAALQSTPANSFGADGRIDTAGSMPLLNGAYSRANPEQPQAVIPVEKAVGATQSANVTSLPLAARFIDVLPRIDALVSAPVQVSKGTDVRIDISARNNVTFPDIIIVEKPHKDHSAAFQAENLFMSRLHVIEGALVDDGGVLSGAASTLSVKVIGETPRGEKIVQPEWANWPARSAMGFGLKQNDDVQAFNAIKYGDVLSVSFPVAASMDGQGVADAQGADMVLPRTEMAGAVGAENMAMAKQISPFLVQSAFYADFAKLFDGIAAQSLILPMQMGAVQSGIMIPSLAKPDAMPAALLFLVAAMRSGDLGAMLSDKISDNLGKMGKAEALSKFLKSAAGKGAEIFSSKPEQGSTAEWKSVMLPMHAEGQVSAVALHWRDYPSGENSEDGGSEDDIARFVLDFTLSAMGDVQLDGFFKSSTLNVALRLSELPSTAMCSRISSFYNDALDQMGLGGDIRFQLVADKAMRFVIDHG
jgi:hypothetical protein